jgi:hypothetical protein
MIHPYNYLNEDTPIEEIEKIPVSLEICTLYKGLPHGMAIIKSIDFEDLNIYGS